MKRIALLVTCISLALCTLAQSQQGYVKTIGKPGKKGVALSGVTVRAKGNHNAVVSKSNGRFTMKMKGFKNGDAYSLQQVQKKGYELNDAGTIGRKYAFSTKVPLTIVMVSTAELQAEKQRIENNAYAVAEKNYKAKMAKLEKQLNENTITAEEYRAALQELQDGFEKYQSLIESLADHYAHTDYDMLDENEAKVNTLIENGELEKADSLIHTLFDPIDVLRRNKEDLARLDQTIADAQGILDQANAAYDAVLKQQEKDAEYLYQLYTIALAQFDNERAAKYIQTRAELDTTNVEWQINAALFYENYLSNYSLALSYLERGLKRAKFEKQDELIAIIINNIGEIKLSQGLCNESMSYFLKAKDLYAMSFGKDHYQTATLYSNLGVLYIMINNFDNALDYLSKALEIQTNRFGEDHISTITTINNIGGLYSRQSDYEKAIEYHKKALSYLENSNNNHQIEIAMTYNNLASNYLSLGNLSQALNFWLKALSIRETIYGTMHDLTADTYFAIGEVYNLQGDYNNALNYVMKALMIDESILTTDNPCVAMLYEYIGNIYVNSGNVNDAIVFYQKSLSMNNTNIIKTINLNYMLGNIFESIGEYEDALGCFKMALEIKTKNDINDNKIFHNNFEEHIAPLEYVVALSKGLIHDYLSNHCFTTTVVDGGPAQQLGMFGEYILLEETNWREDSPISFFDINNELQGKPKDIVVLKDGVITNYHFENAIGAKFGFKQITKEERKQINQLYKQWKKDQKN